MADDAEEGIIINFVDQSVKSVIQFVEHKAKKKKVSRVRLCVSISCSGVYVDSHVLHKK